MTEKQTKYIEILLGGTLFIAFGTSLFYLIGGGYHQGYLSAFGLTDNLIPQTKEDTIIKGFLLLGLAILQAISSVKRIIFTFLIIFGLLLAVIVVSVAVKKKFHEYFSKMIDIFFYIIFSIFLFLIVFVVSFNYGANQGYRHKAIMDNTSLNASNIASIVKYKELDSNVIIKKSLIVKSTDKSITVYGDNQVLVIPYDHIINIKIVNIK